MKNSIKEIRNIWLNFFEEKKHKYIISESLIPKNDDSLLWINSGVATLKKYFSGIDIPPSKKMVNIQKVLRTNDIENVGITSRHHTFFEMMGSFSIGDYFKKESIIYAWELLTSSKYLNIPKNKLYVTVFDEDLDAYNEWIKVGVSKNRIIKMGKKTNFWDMGIGPCGPSTEIFYDKGEKFDSRDGVELIKNDIENDRYVEIWNIVFSQYNNDGKDNYSDLPMKNIDTGAGFERLVSSLQEKPTAFETELFSPIIKKIEEYTNLKYKWNYIPSKLKIDDEKQFKINSYYKVISDFIRAIVFAISDGANPSSNGRGYIIRKLLRRAMLFVKKLGINDLILSILVDQVVDIMYEYYPNLKVNLKRIKEIILKEEKQFIKTLDNGIKLFNQETSNIKKIKEFNEEKAFKLFETYGLPIELILNLSLEKNIKLDSKKINKMFEEFSNNSKINSKKNIAMEVQKNLFLDEEPTNFIGYEKFNSNSKVIKVEGEFVIFDKTPFYATSGGQESDYGRANEFDVNLVFKNSKNVFIHKIPNNNFKKNQIIKLKIDKDRRNKITRNHSAIHLLFSAIENIYNMKISQHGSKVEQDFFRFDFSIQNKVDINKIKEAENLTNKWIKQNFKTEIKILSKEEGLKLNATFLEGKTYGEEVRVVKLNEKTIDFCGGTHVKEIKEIEKVFVTSMKKRGSGIYRIEAISGEELISSYIQKNNLEYLLNKINLFQEKIKILNKKYYSIFGEEFNFENIKEIFKDIQNSKLINDEKFTIEIDKKFIIIDKKLSNINIKIKQKLSENIDEIINNKDEGLKKIYLTDFDLKDIDKLILNKLKNKNNKKVFVMITKNNKITIALVLTKDLINDDGVFKLIEKIKKIGFRGSGSRQLYVFGGEKTLSLNIKRLLLWE